MRISPSILACDLSNIAAEIDSVSEADYIHIDVMDGIFVPNISFGLPELSRPLGEEPPRFLMFIL